MTALRELAERWKAHADVIAARGNMFSVGTIMTKRECADELLSILDADGDGGAVAWLVDGRVEQGLFFDSAAAQKMADANCGKVRPLVYGDVVEKPTHPQPVRSGVVSDEIAEAACSEALRKYRADCPNCEIDGADFDAGFYAALDFAKSLPAVGGGDKRDAERYRKFCKQASEAAFPSSLLEDAFEMGSGVLNLHFDAAIKSQGESNV